MCGLHDAAHVNIKTPSPSPLLNVGMDRLKFGVTRVLEMVYLIFNVLFRKNLTNEIRKDVLKVFIGKSKNRNKYIHEEPF